MSENEVGLVSWRRLLGESGARTSASNSRGVSDVGGVGGGGGGGGGGGIAGNVALLPGHVITTLYGPEELAQPPIMSL